jgi:apolipoprotein N-acyltransferase
VRERVGALSRLYAAAAASGALIAACFLRFELYPLAWLAFVPLLWALRRARTTRDAVRIGFVAGLATNLPAFYWLVYTIHVFGGFSYPVALFAYLCLTLFTACEFVLFAVAWKRTGPGPLALAAPVLWVSLEFLYPNVFLWRMANCQLHAPLLMQIGDLTGPFGLSFVMLWVSAGVAEVIDRPRRDRPRRLVPLAAAGCAVLAVVLYGAIRLPQVEQAIQAAPTVRVALVQGNVGIKEKGDLRYLDINVDTYRQLSEDVQDSVDVIVWPETVDQHWVSADVTRLEGKDNPFENLQRYLIFGGLSFRLRGYNPDDAEEFNSAFLMGPDGLLLSRYDKRILMPFGEYIPLASALPFIRSLSPETGGFTAGQRVSVFDLGGKAKIGQLICYEDIVAGMPRYTTQAGAEILLNILNDAWYGDSAAPYQHQALALWRAIENRRYLLRGSNSGVTSIIDAAGRVVAEGGLFTAEVVSGTVPRLQMMTFYTRFGDVFAWLVVIGALLLLARSWRLARRSRLSNLAARSDQPCPEPRRRGERAIERTPAAGLSGRLAGTARRAACGDPRRSGRASRA